MALPVWRSKGTDAHTATPTTGCTPGLPTGWAQDDVFVATVTTSDAGTLNTPAGWTLKHTQSQATSQLYIFWRRATASESAPTFDAANNTPDYILAVISAYSGCETSGDPFHQITGANATSSTSVSFPSVTTTTADCLICNAISVGTDSISSTLISGWTNAALSSITERYDQATDDGGGGGQAFATAGLATAGAVGNTTATLATASGQAKVTFALMPPQVRTGDLSKTLAAATISAAGAAAIVGTLSKTLAALAISAAGTHPVTGDFSKSLGAVVSSAAGGVATGGALSGTLGAVTIASAGTADPFLNLNVTLGAVTLSSGGQLAIAGAAAVTLGAATSSSAGGVAIAGALAASLGGMTITADGLRELRGVLTVTLASITPTIAGSFPVTADLSKTLGAASISSAANVLVGGALTRTLGTLTGGGAGVVATGGVANATLGSLAPSVAGVVATGGVVNATMAGLALSAAATHPVVGFLRGRNLLPQSEHDTGWVAAGTTPPTVNAAAVEDGYNCVSATFDGSSPTGYSACRATGSSAVCAAGPVTYRSLVKLSRALTGSEQIIVYVTGQWGISSVTLSVASGKNPTAFTDYAVSTTFPGGASAAFFNEYFTIYVGATLSSPVTVFLAERQVENNASFTGYQRSLGVSGAYLGNLGLSIAGAVDQQGALTVTLGGLGLVAEGAGFPIILGDLSQTLGGLAVSAAGVNATGGILTKTLAAATASGAGAVALQGVLSSTLAGLGLSAAGGVGITGVLRGRNLFVRSQEFDDPAWTKTNCTITPNAAIAPDGTLTADKIVSASGSSAQRPQQAVAARVGVDNTVSAYFKVIPGEATWVLLRIAEDLAQSCWFDIANVTLGTRQTGWSNSTITALPNGWVRVSATLTTVVSSYTHRFFLANSNGATVYTGDGVKGIYIWGAQVEEGAVATAYQAQFSVQGGLLGTLTLSSVATIELMGALTVTLGAAVVNSSGSGFPTILGDLSVALAAMTGSADGTAPLAGVLAKTLGPLTVVAAGAIAIEGNVRGINLINNSMMVGAAGGGSLPTGWGTAIAAGLTATYVGVGVESGRTYFELNVSGTPSGLGSGRILFPSGTSSAGILNTTAGDALVFGFDYKLVSGSGVTINAQIDERNAAGTGIGQWNSADSTPNGTIQHVSLPVTLAQPTVAKITPSMVLVAAVGVPISITLRFYRPQVNEGLVEATFQPTYTGVNPLGALQLTAAGSVPIAGALSKTLAAATFSGAGTVVVGGILNAALQDLVPVATGVVAITASLNKTFGSLTLSADGSVLGVGSLTKALAPLTAAIDAGNLVAGSLSQSLAPATASSAGVVATGGILTRTLAPLTLSSQAVVSNEGDLAKTLAALTLAGAGAVDIDGDGGGTLADLGLLAVGRVVVGGSLTIALDPAHVAASGQVVAGGYLTATLGALASDAAGDVAVTGALSKTLSAVTSQADGSVPINGDLDQLFGDLVIAATGAVPVAGALSVVLEDASVAAAGAVPVVGNLARLLGDAGLQAAGRVDTHGSLTRTLGPMGAAATGRVWPFRRFFFSLN